MLLKHKWTVHLLGTGFLFVGWIRQNNIQCHQTHHTALLGFLSVCLPFLCSREEMQISVLSRLESHTVMQCSAWWLYCNEAMRFSSESSDVDVKRAETEVFLWRTLLWRETRRPEVGGSHPPATNPEKRRKLSLCSCWDYYIYGSLFLWFMPDASRCGSLIAAISPLFFWVLLCVNDLLIKSLACFWKPRNQS